MLATSATPSTRSTPTSGDSSSTSTRSPATPYRSPPSNWPTPGTVTSGSSSPPPTVARSPQPKLAPQPTPPPGGRRTAFSTPSAPTPTARAPRNSTLLDQVDDRRGTHDDLWCGNQPGCGIFFHPYGPRYAPIQLWINKAGQLMAYGNWYQYDKIKYHRRFAELAHLVGQDHQSTAKGFPIADLPDLDQFWSVTLRCAEHINRPDAGADHRDVGPTPQSSDPNRHASVPVRERRSMAPGKKFATPRSVVADDERHRRGPYSAPRDSPSPRSPCSHAGASVNCQHGNRMCGHHPD